MNNWLVKVKINVTLGEIILALLALGTLAVLVVYAYAGTFTRYWADDFCFTQYLRTSDNLFNATINLYKTWSNRYTTMLLVGISEWFGQGAISYLPATMIFLWTFSLTILMDQIKAAFKQPRHELSSLLVASILAYLTILQAPDRFQSVYWRSGVVTYFAPLVFYTFSTAIIIHQMRKLGQKDLIPTILLVSLLFFLSGGLSETTLAMQVGGLMMAMTAALFLTQGKSRQITLSMLLAGLAASFISLVVVFKAPGNAIRMTSMPGLPALVDLVSFTLRFGWDFIWQTVTSLPLPTLVTAWTGLLISLDFFGRVNPKATHLKTSRLLLLASLTSLAAFALILCATAPSVFVFGKFGYPAARALLPARFVMTVALFLTGCWAGLFLRQFFARQIASRRIALNLGVTVLLGVTILYPLKTIQSEISSLPNLQRIANGWDNRDTQIKAFKASNTLDITLKGIESPASLNELHPFYNHWVNLCIADFYGLHSIEVFPN